MNDSLLLDTGMQVLVDNLGLVEAERFIFLMNKEPFDYTKWHGALSEGKSVRQLSKEAMELRQTKKDGLSPAPR